jgi:hypothetical protein
MKKDDTILVAGKKKTEIWPLAIIAAFAIFIILVMMAVFRAASEETSLVSADYYEKELVYQEQINREITTRKLNKFISFRFDPRSSQLDITFPLDSNQHKLVTGTVHFYRPSDDKLDFKESIKLDDQGAQHFAVANLKKGVWKVRVTWKEGGLEFYDEAEISI